MLDKFSEISTLKCTTEEDDRHFKVPPGLKDDNSIYFSCFISQTRNYHFEVNFKFDRSDDKSTAFKVNKGYAGYGDFTTLGAIDIDANYSAAMITQTNFGLKNTFEGDAENNLSASYVVVYKRPVSAINPILTSQGEPQKGHTNTTTIIGGVAVPVALSRIKSTMIRIVTIQARTFLIINSNNYYSMAAIEIMDQSEIRIFKDASTKTLEIKAFNHFSTGDLIDHVTDDTLKLFLIILASIILVALVIGFVMKAVKKFSHKEKKHTTFDAIDGAIM